MSDLTTNFNAGLGLGGNPPIAAIETAPAPMPVAVTAPTPYQTPSAAPLEPTQGTVIDTSA